MTTIEIDTELATLPAELSKARATLAELEAENDQTKGGLDAHARAHSKVAMLEARQAALTAARPAAELAEAEERYRACKVEMADAAECERSATIEARAVLESIMMPHGLSDAIRESRIVSDAVARANTARGRLVSAGSAVFDVANRHNMSRPRLKDI